MASRSILLLFQILVAILTLGPVLFLGILFTFGFGPKHGVPFLGDFMTLAAIGVACIATVVNFGLSLTLRRGARGDRAMVAFGIRTVGGAAIFTFATFFASVAMMLEQSSGALVLAVFLIVATASRFPTIGIFRRWTQSGTTGGSAMDATPFKSPVSATAVPEVGNRRRSTIILSIALVAITVAPLANNAIGGFGILAILASPFWVPVCCYFVPYRVACIYAIISGLCLLLTLPLAVLGDFFEFTKGFVFFFGLGSFLMLIACVLGAIIAYSRESKGS